MAPQPNDHQSHPPPPPSPHDTQVPMISQSPVQRPPVSQQQNTSPYLSGQQEPATSSSSSSSDEDPVWLKCKSAVLGGAGTAQSKLGHMMGISDLEDRGQAWEEWAARTSEQANSMTEQGAPSRLHGEYNKWMGYMGKVLGHVSGDPEMEAKGSQRTNEANKEIEKSRR